MVTFLRNSLALHIHIGTPFSRLTDLFFKIFSYTFCYSFLTQFLSITTRKYDIATNKISILFFYISKVWNNAFSGFGYFIIFVFIAFKFTAHSCSVIMKTNIFSK